MPTRRARPRAREIESDIDDIIDEATTPNLSVARQVELRERIEAHFGPYAGPIHRSAAQTAAARRELAELRDQVRRVREGANLCGVTTWAVNGRVRVRVAGVERELPRPDDVVLGVGQRVLLDADGQTVIAPGEYLQGGTLFVCTDQLDERHALVRSLRDDGNADGGQLAILTDAVGVGPLEPGDRVLGYAMDGGNLVLLTRKLGPAGPATEDVGVGVDVRRHDLVGLDEIMQETDLLFLQATEGPMARLAARVSRGVRGVLFQGEPGTGKSELAQCYVGEVVRRGGCALYRTGPSYLSKWVGAGAAALRADFAHLEKSWEERGVRPLIVIDEIESIALDRRHMHGTGAGHLEVLNELLGLVTRTEVRVIAISNVANRLIEPALLRSGRLRVLAFPAALDAADAAALVEQCLRDVPLAGDTRQFADALGDFVFAPSGSLAELVRVQLADGRELTFPAAAFATGAAIADGIVRPLLARHLRDDLAADRDVPTPVTLDELYAAAVEHFTSWARGITRDNARSVLGDRVPEDQAVTSAECPARA